MKTLSSALFLALSLVACAATTNDDTEESTSEALTSRTNFTCSGGYCSCEGDTDCNLMFSGTACGDGPAQCQINGADIPRCVCTRPATGVGHARPRPPITPVQPVISHSP